MNLLEKICKELGVEIGKEWVGTDKGLYKFDNHGNLLKYHNSHKNWYKEQYLTSKIISGELKPVWKPKIGEEYFFPYIDMETHERWDFSYWEDTNIDMWYLENNLVFKTKEEALKATNKMLKVLREE